MAQGIWGNSQARLFFWYLIVLLAALLGQDILLEPFAAEAFGMSVRETTQITSFWGIFVMLALILTGWLESRYPKHQIAFWGGWGAFLGFGLITFSGFIQSQAWFFTGVLFLGVGTGISTVSNLSLMLDMTMAGQVGQFIGAWGMANAISRLVGSVLGGAGRDVLARLTKDAIFGYTMVFGMMAVFMLISLVLLRKISVQEFQKNSDQQSVIERAAIAGDV
jgi:BCD family chlorophyll transporter-like MFS transporter